jgi:hypothetical protein
MNFFRNVLLALGAAPAALAAGGDGLESCLNSAVTGGGNVAFPSDPFYQISDVSPYNLNIAVTPAAVAFPTSSAQVAAIVKCAADRGYHVQAKSGGHSYGNYGMLEHVYDYFDDN